MASTLDIPVGPDDWAQVNGVDVTHVTLQLKSSGPVLVNVAATKPSASSSEGIMLVKGELEELPLPGLVAGDKVWLRSVESEDNNVATYQVPL